MGLLDSVATFAEERFGTSLIDREELTGLRESAWQFQQFREEASELAYNALDHFTGRGPVMRPGERNRLAQRSRNALLRDPLAGSEANHLANFGFGKGVATPDAEDERVQEVIEEGWTDPVNEEKLTGFSAQRYRSNQLLTDANLFPTAFLRNGKVRLGFLDADRVIEIICDEEDDERPLWYVYEEPRKSSWNFDADRWDLFGEGRTAGASNDGGVKPKVVYYPHWRNVEDVSRERLAAGMEPLEIPPREKLGTGVVFHLAINRIGRSQFGTPPWARTMRFYSAMNDVVESHVAMAQAASSFVAKRVMKGSPEGITRAANAILTQTGEIGAARFGTGDPPGDLYGASPFGTPAPAPGSFAIENETHKLESLQLQSGAAQAQQTTSIVRAPISAASGFGQHYMGDASNANLATATSLELPTLMTVEAWQEGFAQVNRWFTALLIQTALRAGRFGGEKKVPEEAEKALSELHVSEAEERADAEERTGIKLDYKFAMPYPGRRNLPDATTTFTSAIGAIDPSGQNVPFRRAMLLWFAQHGLQVDDPRSWVDDVLPEEAADAIARQAMQQSAQAEVDAQMGSREREAQIAQQEYAAANPQGDPTVKPGGPGRGEVPQGAKGVQEELAEIGAGTAGLFNVMVVDPALRNGNGA